MLNSAEPDIDPAHKCQNAILTFISRIRDLTIIFLFDGDFSLKNPLILAILTFMTSLNFMLS